MSPFRDNEIEIKYPSHGQYEQVQSSFRAPTLGFRDKMTIKWTDSVDDILYIMKYVQYMDKHWNDIEEIMRPHLENIAVKTKKLHKEIWGTFRVQVQDIVDVANEATPENPLPLEENKRKIKVLLKK
jgi:hypothetical protein